MSLLNHLKEVRELKSNNVSSRKAKRSGTETFDELSNLLQNEEISNDSNREVELEEKDQYNNKLGHLLRFVPAISEKSAMLITVLRDGLDDVGYIRDDGTLSGLALRGGEYYDIAVISPNEISVMIEEIDEEFEISSIDREFIDMVEDVFARLSEEERKLPISWKSIVEDNDEIKDFYFSTTLDYVINLLTMKQHSKDMRLANLQPNPWISFQYYWVPNKLLQEYKNILLGKKLFEFVSDKPGLSYSVAGKIMGKLNPQSKPMKKSEKLKWLVISYCGSEFCDTKEDFQKFIEMVGRFHQDDNPKIFTYWLNMFKRFVKDVSYSEIEFYYNNKFKKVYESSLWGNGKSGPNYILNKLVKTAEKAGGTATCEAITKFNISREINGIVFISYAIWAKDKYNKGWDKTIQLIVNQYILTLEGSVYCTAKPSDTWNTGSYPVWKALWKKYIGTAVEKRVKYIFGPMMDGVESNIHKKKQDRYHESVLRSKSLDKHYTTLNGERLSTRITVFPLASNGSLTDVVTINFGKGDNLHWLHPNDDKNMAKDGFLGILGDNLDKKFKNMDWTPYIKNNSNYWKIIFDHNEDRVDELEDGSLKRKVNRSLDTLEWLSDVDLNV